MRTSGSAGGSCCPERCTKIRVFDALLFMCAKLGLKFGSGSYIYFLITEPWGSCLGQCGS